MAESILTPADERRARTFLEHLLDAQPGEAGR
jgi:hypothetical protein